MAIHDVLSIVRRRLDAAQIVISGNGLCKLQGLQCKPGYGDNLHVGLISFIARREPHLQAPPRFSMSLEMRLARRHIKVHFSITNPRPYMYKFGGGGGSAM